MESTLFQQYFSASLSLSNKTTASGFQEIKKKIWLLDSENKKKNFWYFKIVTLKWIIPTEKAFCV